MHAAYSSPIHCKECDQADAACVNMCVCMCLRLLACVLFNTAVDNNGTEDSEPDIML